MSKFQIIQLALLGFILMTTTISAGFDLWLGWTAHQLMSAWSNPFGMSMPPPPTPAVTPAAGVVMPPLPVPVFPVPAPTTAADFRVAMLERNYVLNSADHRWYPLALIKHSGCTIHGPRYGATILNCKYPINPANGLADAE
jgi:hypothetical protein